MCGVARNARDRPGRAPAAAAASHAEPDADRLQLRRRPLDRPARRRRRAPADERRRRRERSLLLTRRDTGRVHGRVRRQRGRLRHACRRRRAETADLSSGHRRGDRVDARRQERHLHFHSRELLPRGRPDVHRAVERRLRRAVAAADCRAGLLLARRVAPRLRAASAVAAGLEALPRRPDDADLDRRPGRFEGRARTARQLERLQPDVGRQHDLLPLGSQRSGEPLRVRPDHEAGDRSGEERRPRLQVGVSGTRRDCHRAVRRAQAVRHGDAPGEDDRRHPRRRFPRGAAAVRQGGRRSAFTTSASRRRAFAP